MGNFGMDFKNRIVSSKANCNKNQKLEEKIGFCAILFLLADMQQCAENETKEEKKKYEGTLSRNNLCCVSLEIQEQPRRGRKISRR